MKPVVKWAGGKGQLLERIHEFMPKKFNHYYEPFIGGGAVLFSFKPKHAAINDVNQDLLAVYKSLKDIKVLEKLFILLDMHQEKHSESYYYEIRGLDRMDSFKDMSLAEKAARMIYLNKAGYNGMYRVNAKGYFNIPWNKSLSVNLYDKENMMEIHHYFNEVDMKITNLDFEQAVKDSVRDDFVYFDPPYDPYEDKNNFTNYAKDGFDRNDQKRLFETFKALSDKGIYVMLSNHNTAFIRDLYKDYYISIVPARRMINSKASNRGPVEEVIIRNYE